MLRTDLRYGTEFASRIFSAQDYKSAYLKAAKWYATNILANKFMKNVLVEYEKKENGNTKQIIVHLFIAMPDDELLKRHCDICKEAHRSLFGTGGGDLDCNYCRLRSFYKRQLDTIAIKRAYYADLLCRKEHEGEE